MPEERIRKSGVISVMPLFRLFRNVISVIAVPQQHFFLSVTEISVFVNIGIFSNHFHFRRVYRV